MRPGGIDGDDECKHGNDGQAAIQEIQEIHEIHEIHAIHAEGTGCKVVINKLSRWFN